MLRGAAGRELLHSSYPAQPKKLPDEGTALGLGDRVLPCHHSWGHCSGSGAIVWTHNTCRNPLSLSLVERPSLAAQLPQAVLSTKGVLSHSHHPKSPKILPTVWISRSAVSAAPSLSNPSTPLLYPPCSGHPQIVTTLRGQAPADLRGNPPSPWARERGKINDHKWPDMERYDGTGGNVLCPPVLRGSLPHVNFLSRFSIPSSPI